MSFVRDLRHAARGLLHARGFYLAVVVTLGLGIGANAAIFSVVRGILLRPLPNRDEARLIYLRQTARGIGSENARFSVPEIADLRARVKTLTMLGEFSTIGFTMVGLGEPRVVSAGVVDGRYFAVMGLRPVLGRLLGPEDDGPSAAGAAVLTHDFWTAALGSNPAILGRTIRLGTRTATIVGVLEPAVAYPTQTELIANVVTSPHHLSATMVTGREHRMTEVFGRLAPGLDLDAVRAELEAVHGAIKSEHAEAYDPNADFRVEAVRLRDQITTQARAILLILMTAAGLVFVIACANVANLVLARTVRRGPELALRAALGASRGMLRRVLLAECLLLSVSGAVVGVLIAAPSVSVLARYAARFTVRAQDLTLDTTLLSVAAILSIAAALLFAFVPRLPGLDSTGGGTSLAGGSSRVTGRAKGGQRAFAVAQLAASFVLLTGAGLLLRTLLALQATQPGFETENVLAVNVPVTTYGRTPEQVRVFYEEVQRRVEALPGVRSVAVGSTVPWRDVSDFGGDFKFAIDGAPAGARGEDPRAAFRSVSPRYFPTLGIPLLGGRDFADTDRDGRERVVIISESVARRLLPGKDAVGRVLRWTDPVMQFIDVSTEARRIVGVAADVRDQGAGDAADLIVYHPFQQELGGGRLFVHAEGNPYALVRPITRLVRELAADQPVEQGSTLEDIRADVLAPSRLNALVIGGFAIVALAVAVVGVASVLAFSVSGRTREFGIRLALGSQPRDLLTTVLSEGAAIALVGIGIGCVASLMLTQLISGLLYRLHPRDPITLLASAAVLGLAAVVAAVVPAMKAARVDVVQALRRD